jgi:hypothetical protein
LKIASVIFVVKCFEIFVAFVDSVPIPFSITVATVLYYRRVRRNCIHTPVNKMPNFACLNQEEFPLCFSDCQLGLDIAAERQIK